MIDHNKIIEDDFRRSSAIMSQLLKREKGTRNNNKRIRKTRADFARMRLIEKGIEMKKMFAGATVKSVDQEERTLVGLASSDAVDRDREKILKGSSSADLDEYRRNPILMLSLRNEKGLPYIRVSRIRRLYLLSSLLEWAKENITKTDGG